MLNWIINYLKDRKQRVILGNTILDWLNVLSGVPLGSVLGPVLFVIFINNLASQIKNIPKFFADDTKMIGIIKDKNDSISLQNDINIISKWCKTWQMSLNESKCKVVHIGKSNPKLNYQVMIKLILKKISPSNQNCTCGHNLKYSKEISVHNYRENILLNRAANYWNAVPENVVKANSVSSFKARLDQWESNHHKT
ncbi:uncharacterized protein LOC136079128 [Hydra vulgaris]|uniref:Uncharacterized protein LOC136079128 n=1 Tax=Hydra vulgaris TaxID=6087 RepID=A0ABM4BP63_HYDVU